uniref:hypothetical protein n=1 Tax=Ningiella ruwaisensis TaxID=2364274 RepID=UPI00109F4F20|nr:hypothetical protein [Ningiella ruwaisensis]
MSENAIPSIKTLNKLADAAASQHSMVNGNQSLKVGYSKTAVSFTVLSANASQVVLQDNANKQQYSIQRSALSFANASDADAGSNLNHYAGANSPAIKRADQLVLISANNKHIQFRLLSANHSSSANAGQPASDKGVAGIPGDNKLASVPTHISSQQNNALIKSWPELNLSVTHAVPLKVSAQSTFSVTDPKLTALAQNISASAVGKGKPLIELTLVGKLKAIQNGGNNISNLLVALNLKPNALAAIGNKNLILPIDSAKLAEFSIKPGATVNIELAAPSFSSSSASTTASLKSQVIKSLDIQSSAHNKSYALNQSELLAANKNNRFLYEAFQNLSKHMLFSHPLKHAIVQNLSSQLLNALPKDFAQQIRSNIDVNRLNDARLLIANDKQASEAHNPIVNLSVVEKPLIVNIDTQSLMQTSSSKNTRTAHSANSLAKLSANLGLSQETVSTQANDASQLYKTENVVSSGKGMNIEGRSVTPSQFLDAVKNALNHTLSHSEKSTENVNNLLTVIKQVGLQSGSEVRQLLLPLFKQLNSLSSYESFFNTSTNSTEIKNTENSANDSTKNRNELLQWSGANALRELLSASAVTQLFPHSLSNEAFTQKSVQASSLIDGLLNVLKLSLAAQHANKLGSGAFATPSPQQQAAIAQLTPLIAQALQGMKTPSAQAARNTQNRVLQDFAQADPRGRLISEIGKLLSSHNTQKLRSAEATLQGAETYYYALPNPFSKQANDIEIAIKRENPSNDKDSAEANKTWKLDMKLDIGKRGIVLAKTQIIDTRIDLHLYASNDALKHQTEKYLPFLLERFKAHGLEIGRHACDLGKLDASIIKTELNVMHTYA